MQRRSFMQATGAFLLAPLVRLQQEIDPHKYLGLFCDDGEYRKYDFNRPYAMAGNVYATDARIIARVLDCGKFYADEKLRVPKKTPETWDQYYADAERKWRPLEPANFIPHFPPVWGECPLCADLGECPKCDGEGYVIDNDGNEYAHDCPACGGSGLARNPKCTLCGGKRTSEDVPCLQPVGNKFIDGRYYLKLLRIPGCEINYAANDLGMPILFRSEIGIAGICMPVVWLGDERG